MKNKVFVIGLDGATFELLGPWIEAGSLPCLKAMREGGVSGELESTVPPVTAPSWISFMTGQNPGKHGVYDFVALDRMTYEYRPVSGQPWRGKALWDLVAQQGGNVVVMNLPPTYPPYPVPGVMISGFLTPTGKRDFVYPPGLLEEVEARFGPYPLYPAIPRFVVSRDDADVDQFLREYSQALAYKFDVAQYLIEKVDPDFLMLHIYGSDQISHWLWHILDETHPRYRPAASRKHGAKILEYYRQLDAAIGQLVSSLDEDTTVMVLSDHGFGPAHEFIDLNVWLLEQGYLRLKSRPATRLKYALWKMGMTPETVINSEWVRKLAGKLTKTILRVKPQSPVDQAVRAMSLGTSLFLSPKDIDWSHTRAYSTGLGIVINLRGTWAQGCVSPGDEYEKLRRELVAGLGALRDPTTGQKIQGEILVKEDLYSGEFFDDAPDIHFLPMEQNYAPKKGSFVSNRLASEISLAVTGYHKMNGLLLAAGRPLRQGARITGARVIDLCPSILYLMGLKIPKNVDGRVLRGMFSQAFLQDRPIELMDEVEEMGGKAMKLGDREEADLLARLQQLGYLD